MPRKLRAPKQRYDAKAELEAWSMTFESGHDYFRETGFVEPVHVWPPEDRPLAERAFRSAALAAWLRVGALFLERRKAANEHRDLPWAQVEFGEPPCR